MAQITASRYHDFSSGHRVVGHENKCRHLHGHNYRIHFHCQGDLDELGRVIDFGVIKSCLCEWLERNWDHKMILWEEDPMWKEMFERYTNAITSTISASPLQMEVQGSVVLVPFNPTAENMAVFLLNEVGPAELDGSGVTLTKVVIEETRKCSAEASL